MWHRVEIAFEAWIEMDVRANDPLTNDTTMDLYAAAAHTLRVVEEEGVPLQELTRSARVLERLLEHAESFDKAANKATCV
jgi:hypothetical protein